MTDAFVRCSRPGCLIVIGNGGHGAKKPRPCSMCANERKRESQALMARQRRARKAGLHCLEVPEPRSGLWAKP